MYLNPLCFDCKKKKKKKKAFLPKTWNISVHFSTLKFSCLFNSIPPKKLSLTFVFLFDLSLLCLNYLALWKIGGRELEKCPTWGKFNHALSLDSFACCTWTLSSHVCLMVISPSDWGIKEPQKHIGRKEENICFANLTRLGCQKL